jgi:hypothetical protein
MMQTHDIKHEWRENEKQLKFTDTRLDEQVRAASVLLGQLLGACMAHA